MTLSTPSLEYFALLIQRVLKKYETAGSLDAGKILEDHHFPTSYLQQIAIGNSFLLAMAPITRSSLHGRPVDQPRVSHKVLRIHARNTDLVMQQVRDSHTPAQHDEYEPEDESMVDDYGEAEDDDGEVGGVFPCQICAATS